MITPAHGPRPHRITAALRTCCLLGPGLLLAAGCVTVKPVVLDRKTQLENQILGTFQRLEEDLILASSVRGERANDSLSPHQREAVEAMMLREFQRDDIEALKTRGVVGEAKSGMLALLAPPSEEPEAARVKALLAAENGARMVILRRVIASSRELAERDLPLLQLLFYRLNLQTARPGDRVQQETGTWTVVPPKQGQSS